MKLPVFAQRRTLNFVRHYWELFRFVGPHIGMRRLLQVAAFSMTAVAAQGGILFLAATFANAMDSGGVKLQKLGLGFLAGNTLAALIVFSVPTLLLLLYSSFAGYLAAKYMQECNRITQTQLGRLLLTQMHSLDRANLSYIIPDTSSLKRVLGGPALIQAGKSVETILQLIRPTVYLVIGLATIVYLDPLLSVALMMIASIMVPLFYLLSRRIQENAYNFYSRHKLGKGHAVSTLAVRLQSANAGQASRFQEDWLDKHPAYEDFLNAYDRLRLAPSYMALRASLLRSVFVVCGFISFGWLAIEGQQPWSILVVYIGALLFFATGLQTLLTSLAMLIRYYPQTRTASIIVERLKTARESATVAPDIPAKINLAARSRIGGSERRRAIARGEFAILLTKTPLLRHSFQTFLQPMRRASDAPASLWDTATFLASAQPLPQDTVARAVLGENSCESKRAWLEAFLVQALDSSYQELLPQGLDTELSEKRWDSYPQRVRAALQLASVCAEARGVLFLHAGLAATLPADLIRDLPRTQEVHYVFIVSSNLNLPLSAEHYVVADERNVIGLGDVSWFEMQRDTIAPLISSAEKDDTLLDDDEDIDG